VLTQWCVLSTTNMGIHMCRSVCSNTFRYIHYLGNKRSRFCCCCCCCCGADKQIKLCTICFGTSQRP